MARKQLSPETMPMICVSNFRFIYTSIWVRSHRGQQRLIHSQRSEAPGSPGGSGRRGPESRLVLSGCPRRWQEVVKKRASDLGFRPIDGGLGAMSGPETAGTAREQRVFLPPGGPRGLCNNMILQTVGSTMSTLPRAEGWLGFGRPRRAEGRGSRHLPANGSAGTPERPRGNRLPCASRGCGEREPPRPPGTWLPVQGAAGVETLGGAGRSRASERTACGGLSGDALRLTHGSTPGRLPQ